AAGVEDGKDKLVAYGRACLAKGWDYSGNALDAFEAAGASDDLLACGNAWLEEGKVGIALRALMASGVKPLKRQFQACGDACLRNGWLDMALAAYREAGDKDR